LIFKKKIMGIGDRLRIVFAGPSPEEAAAEAAKGHNEKAAREADAIRRRQERGEVAEADASWRSMDKGMGPREMQDAKKADADMTTQRIKEIEDRLDKAA